ncbi:MAG: methylated-DNA--[protein]-cysteine S-methyltransferase [Magnetococcales bacterium]|nr:methylated-DNA--[protein]-cysteine S-methyltransferase [Magnetococcales bacterium]
MTTATPISTPVGNLWLTVEQRALVALSWQPGPGYQTKADREVWKRASVWLTDYFNLKAADSRTDLAAKPCFVQTPSNGDFNFNLDREPPPFSFFFNPSGTPFQRRVWQHLLTIPLAQTVTYGTLAKQLNTSPRAIGQAVGANPIPILIPCHRVLSQNGWGGYSGFGGVETKQKLMALEVQKIRQNH